ncbi:MAG: HAD-IB family hydrolase [Ilumatobacteraceae bacterium]
MNRRSANGGPQAAAVFDLDRTLIAGPSATVFADSLRTAGISQRRVPGAELVAASYQALGETMLTAAAARLAARATSGWSTAVVRAAAEAAADRLMTIVQPYAPGVIAEHREAGRLLVMATTSPAALVTPFAERLGMDAVVATRWSTRDGEYTGELDGDVVWGRGKLEAVRTWASTEQVDLRSSWAYSDSFYDAPLLAAVGHAVAVNPDVRLGALARLRGWTVRYLDLPEGVPKIAGRELQDWTRFLQRPELLLNVRLDVAGIEKIPRDGAVIAVFNHRSYFDATVVGAVLGQTGRSFRFLGKKEVFDAPLIGAFSRMAGGIRVNRSSGSNEPLDQALKVLEAGEAIALAPEGTIPRGPAFFATELQGRWGAARLAAASKAPVVPVALWGTEKVWPRNSRLPRLSFSDRPVIRVRVGDPVPLAHRSPDADTKRIMRALVDLLPDEARVARTPTAEELAATYPPGYRGDPTLENERRPGTDTRTSRTARRAGAKES